jgi:hypothetical protein
MPGIEQMHALVRLAELARIVRVHDQAERATVELGSPNFDQLQQRPFHAA